MTRQYRRLLGSLVLLVLPASGAMAQTGKFDLARTKAVLTPIIEKTLAENGIPSMSIALVRGDSIVWTAAFGYSNMYTHARATTETLYSTGSSFKSVTGTAVMQLVQQGKIRLNDPINRYLGDHPVQDRLQSEKQVTVTDILSHWSGLISGAEV
jgi:CubicO group peptidase (beta-lactamase class C family)